MPLAKPAQVDVEANIFGHRFITAMTADVVFANMSGGITVLFERLGNRDRSRSNIFGLLGAFKTSGCFFDSASAKSVQISDHVDIIVDAGWILPRQHRSPCGSTVGLGISMRKAESTSGQFFDRWCLINILRRAHRRLFRTEVIPSQVVDHIDDDVGLGLSLTRVGCDRACL